MSNFFVNIWEYLKSPDFNAVLMSILAGYAVVAPVINKLIKTRTNARLELARSKAENASKEINQYIEHTKILQEQIMQLIESGSGQAKAFKLAFDRSNLKEDVKTEISKLLNAPEIEELKRQVSAIGETALDKTTEVIKKADQKKTEFIDKVEEKAEKISNFIRDIV